MAKTIKEGLPVISSFGKLNNDEEVGIIHEIRISPEKIENKSVLDYEPKYPMRDYKIQYIVSGIISPWITHDGKSSDGSVKSISMEKFFIILEKEKRRMIEEIKILKDKVNNVNKHLKEIYIGSAHQL